MADFPESELAVASPAESEVVAPPPKRRLRLILIGVAIVAIAVFAFWLVGYETHGKYVQSTNDAYLRADSVTVSPKVSGYVDQVFVGDNQDVAAGQPLVRIDARDYRALASQYQAQIDVAAANAENVRAGELEQRSQIEGARAQLSAAETQARFAASEVARYAPLAASGAETRERLTTLENEAAQAAGRAAAQRAALASAVRRIASLQAQTRQAEAQGESARAQLSAANVNLGSTIVRASIAGRIGDKSVRAGQFVQAGTRMMSVVPLAGIYIAANFKETQIGRMRIGQPVTIRVDALPGVDLRGRVESLSPGTGAEFSLLPPQNATGNFTKIVQRVPVRIAIEAGPEVRSILVPGLSATVSVDTIAARGAEDSIRDQQRREQGAR